LKTKVAFVVQRYGIQVNGGAELHCRWIAEQMQDFWQVNVLTTCALDYLSWENYYPEGVEKINGVIVHRFPVSKPRDIREFNRLSEKIFNAPHSYKDEIAWMEAQGPNSPELLRYLRTKNHYYDVFIFFTYLYATTFWGLPIVENKALLVPTAHDEPPIFLDIFKDFFKRPKGFIFNTLEEKRFLVSLFHISCHYSDVIGVGINFDFSKARKIIFSPALPKRYIVYVGRIEEAKGCKQLFEYWSKYKQSQISDLKLVLVGKPQMKIPERNDIISLGFLSEDEKHAVISKSTCLIVPSFFESLSMTLLEAWLNKKPVLVNGRCIVLKNQCRRSNGGLWYENYGEFKACLNLLLKDEKLNRVLGLNGNRFVNFEYDWDVIKKKYLSLVNSVKV